MRTNQNVKMSLFINPRVFVTHEPTKAMTHEATKQLNKRHTVLISKQSATMRFLWTAAAFVSSTGIRKTHESSSTGVCSLVPPPIVVELPPADASFQQQPQSIVKTAIQEWLAVPPAYAAETPAPPSQKEIDLLREAMASFYGVDRDLEKSEQLLTEAINAWQRQPPDEKAALYRVRGDCFMAQLKPQEAEKDYTTTIDLLEGRRVVILPILPNCRRHCSVEHALFVVRVW
jgi:hypothetical protein